MTVINFDPVILWPHFLKYQYFFLLDGFLIVIEAIELGCTTDD